MRNILEKNELLEKYEHYSTFKVKDKTCRIHIVDEIEIRKKSYRLMYDVYSSIGYGKSHESGLWYSLHELLEDAVTICVVHDEDVIATMTVLYDNPVGLPADEVYKQELDRLRSKGHRFAEVFSLSIRADWRENEILMGRMIYFCYLVSRYGFNATHFVITIIPEHAAFYRDRLLFEVMAKDGLHEKTGVYCYLLEQDLNLFQQCSEEVRRNTYFQYYLQRNDETEVGAYIAERICPISAEDFHYFIDKRKDIYENASSVKKGYIRNKLNEYKQI